MTVFPEKDQVSLTTHGGHSRVRADLVLLDNEEGYQYRYLDGDEREPTESTLHYRDGEWYLYLGFRKPNQNADETTENGTVLGVDIGVNEIAVTSTARFFQLVNSTTSDGSSSTRVATSKSVARGARIGRSNV